MKKLVMKKLIIPTALKGASDPHKWSEKEMEHLNELQSLPLAFNKVPEPGGTPDHIRQALSKLALLESGGKRVSVNLSGKAVQDLERVKRRDGTDNTQSIIAALAAFAKK